LPDSVHRVCAFMFICEWLSCRMSEAMFSKMFEIIASSSISRQTWSSTDVISKSARPSMPACSNAATYLRKSNFQYANVVLLLGVGAVLRHAQAPQPNADVFDAPCLG
jgi:hypothetical protein